MGRRKDDPALQAAKGFPGRRTKQTKRAIEAASAAAAAEAEATSGDPYAVPAQFKGAPAYYRRAIRTWNAQATVLRATGRKRPGYRGALARYCVWCQMFDDAVEQLRRDCPKGELTKEWTPVGSDTPRLIAHPSLKVMKDIEPILRAIEDDFGFTPRSDVNLVRVEAFNRSNPQSDLFSQGRPADSAASDGAVEEGPVGDPMDLMTETDSAPPSRLN